MQTNFVDLASDIFIGESNIGLNYLFISKIFKFGHIGFLNFTDFVTTEKNRVLLTFRPHTGKEYIVKEV